MPALMLSGFIYDLRSVPLAIRLVSYLVPARYYVSLLQTHVPGRRRLERDLAERRHPCWRCRGHACRSTRRATRKSLG